MREPKQIVPLPTALHGSNEGGGGFKVCVTGCLARAGMLGISTASAMTKATIPDAIERFIGTLLSPLPDNRTGPRSTVVVSSARLFRQELSHGRAVDRRDAVSGSEPITRDVAL